MHIQDKIPHLFIFLKEASRSKSDYLYLILETLIVNYERKHLICEQEIEISKYIKVEKIS